MDFFRTPFDAGRIEKLKISILCSLSWLIFHRAAGMWPQNDLLVVRQSHQPIVCYWPGAYGQ